MVNGYDKLKGEIERIVNRDYDIELKELRGRARDSNHRAILTLKLSRDYKDRSILTLEEFCNELEDLNNKLKQINRKAWEIGLFFAVKNY